MHLRGPKSLKVVVLNLVILAVVVAFFWFIRATLAQDSVPPRVISTDPHMGQGGVATNAWIRATFSEPLDPSSITSGTFTLKASVGDPVSGNVSYANRTAVFMPFTHLGGNATYRATVSSQVRDVSGNSLGGNYSWSFSTGMD